MKALITKNIYIYNLAIKSAGCLRSLTFVPWLWNGDEECAAQHTYASQKSKGV